MNTRNTLNTRIRRWRRRSFSMAEAAIAIVIVGVMMVTALNMVGMSARARSVNAQLGKAPALAHGLLNEVLQAFYEEPDTDPILTEGPEVELASYDPGSPDEKDFDVKDNRYIGQVFRPTLPDDAASWSVTRVMFVAKSDGATDGIASIQLRPLDDSGKPTAAILEAHPMPESDLSSSYAWQTFEYSTVTGIAPGAGLAFVVAVQVDDNIVCKVQHDHSGGGGCAETSNAGSTWTTTAAGLTHYVYGKITTESVASDSLGPEPSEGTSTRADFDDVDDYHGWSASPPEDKSGNPLPDYTGWTREVSVAYISPVQPGGASINEDKGVKRVTVTVTDPNGGVTTVIGVRSNLGAHEQEVAATRTYVSWVGLDLQIGQANAALSLGTAMANEPLAN